MLQASTHFIFDYHQYVWLQIYTRNQLNISPSPIMAYRHGQISTALSQAKAVLLPAPALLRDWVKYAHYIKDK